MDSMDYEIALNIALDKEDILHEIRCKELGIEPWPEIKPYEKHTLEGGTRKPTRLELLRLKKKKQ